MAWVITSPCISEVQAKCIDVCPESCIELSVHSNQYFINPNKCTDCGLCDLVCPVAAIFHENDVPKQWLSSIAANREYFSANN